MATSAGALANGAVAVPAPGPTLATVSGVAVSSAQACEAMNSRCRSVSASRSSSGGGDSQAKRAGDAWDLHQLLTLHNRAGAISAALRDAAAVLTTAVRQTADVVLVAGATRTRSWLRTSGGVQATIGADEIRVLGRQLLEGLDGPSWTLSDGPERR